MAAPRRYGPTLRFARRFRRARPEFEYALAAGGPLLAGWTLLLLLWADRRPLERRGVLALTVMPVIGGRMGQRRACRRDGRLSAAGVWTVRALQIALAGLFTYGYRRAARAEARRPGLTGAPARTTAGRPS